MGKEQGNSYIEKGQKKFEAAKAHVIRALHHPYIPGKTAQRLISTLHKTQVLSDEEFDSVMLQASIIGDASENSELRELIKEQTQSLTAFFLPPFLGDLPPIIFRARALVEDLNYPPEFYILHELSHSLAAVKKVPFDELNDNTLYLWPHETKQEALNIHKQSVDGELVVYLHGFQADIRNETHRFSYPKVKERNAFEEARASIIQTILTMNTGLREKLEKTREQELTFFFREALAVEFLNTYRKNRPFMSVDGTVRKLLHHLSMRGPDEFMDMLVSNERESVMTIVDFFSKKLTRDTIGG